MAAVDVQGLRVLRGDSLVLDGLSLQVPAGRITGLLGPSGSGKTTLLRSIVGVQRVAGGRVAVLGADAGSAGLRRRVAYMTQAPSVYGDLTARQNLEFFADVLGVARRRVGECLESVGLADRAGQLVATMSGGQRARVSLASALLGEPELLVLDEPTVGLDPVLRDELWGTFASLAAGGATLIVSSHVMDEAERCDSLLLIREGRLLATGTPTELRERVGAGSVGDAFLALIKLQEERS